MKPPVCVEMKNKIQAEILRAYSVVPKAEWSRKQAEALAKSPSPIAEFWRRIKPAQDPYGCQVAEAGMDYGNKDRTK